MRHAPLDLPDNPKLVTNITHFARALRRAGLKIGPGRIIDAVRAVAAVGFSNKPDFFWTLHACFVTRPEDRAVFAQVFRLYWRDPQYLEHMMSLLLPSIGGVAEERVAQAAEKRAAQALLDDVDMPPPIPDEEPPVEIDIDASQTSSAQQRLKTLDFEQMSAAEMREATRILATLRLPVPPIKSRRTVALAGPRPDWRATMRDARRLGGEVAHLRTKRPRLRYPNLVVLCDISGSMSAYSRAVLHFVHAVANRQGQGWAQVHAFTFGTELTNITRHMRTRDVDAALARAGAQAQDWEGGTRIADCLDRFNRDWSRRVMGQGAVVLLITDGLDREGDAALGPVMRRLSLTARQLIWINPLLRYEGFAPKTKGIAEILPHVDTFCAGHNIAQLEGLAAALRTPADGGDKARFMAALTQERAIHDKAQETDRLGWSLANKLAALRSAQ